MWNAGSSFNASYTLYLPLFFFFWWLSVPLHQKRLRAHRQIACWYLRGRETHKCFWVQQRAVYTWQQGIPLGYDLSSANRKLGQFVIWSQKANEELFSFCKAWEVLHSHQKSLSEPLKSSLIACPLSSLKWLPDRILDPLSLHQTPLLKDFLHLWAWRQEQQTAHTHTYKLIHAYPTPTPHVQETMNLENEYLRISSSGGSLLVQLPAVPTFFVHTYLHYFRKNHLQILQAGSTKRESHQSVVQLYHPGLGAGKFASPEAEFNFQTQWLDSLVHKSQPNSCTQCCDLFAGSELTAESPWVIETWNHG